MTFRSEDPERDFLRDDTRKEDELKKMPKCSHCNEHIQDGYLFDLGDGEIYCEQCAFDLFRKDTVDYIG